MNPRCWAMAMMLATFGCRASPATDPSLAKRAEATFSKTSPSAAARPVSQLDKILPDVAPPFTAAAPIQYGQGFVRRVYLSRAERVEITIARFGQEPGAFERWVANSAAYPPAQLSLPASQANGFFSRAAQLANAPCDLHIQLRSGFHIEVMGNAGVRRRDLTQLMTHIRLSDLTSAAMAAL